MKPGRLNLWAVVSLVLLVILIAGYPVESSVVVWKLSATPGTANLHEHAFKFATREGRVALYWIDNLIPPTPPAQVGWHAGSHIELMRRWPDAKRWLYGFDAHWIVQGSLYIVAFPIWAPILPLTIAPLMWLRRRRRAKQQVQAFEVVTRNESV